MERIEKVRTYILLVNAAAGTCSMRARLLAQRLAQDLQYPDPVKVTPAVALEPALVEIEKAVDGHYWSGSQWRLPAGDTWG